MDFPENDQHRAQELRLQNSKRADAGKAGRQYSSELLEFDSPTCKSRTEANGCLANGNATCCQHHTSVEEEDDFNTNGGQIKVSAGKKGRKQLLRNISYKGAGKRKVCSMPSCMRAGNAKIHMRPLLLFVLLSLLVLRIGATSNCSIIAHVLLAIALLVSVHLDGLYVDIIKGKCDVIVKQAMRFPFFAVRLEYPCNKTGLCVPADPLQEG